MDSKSEHNLCLAQEYMKAHPNDTLYPVTFDRPEDATRLIKLVKLSDVEVERYKVLEQEYDEPWEEYEELIERLLMDESFPFVDPDNPWMVANIELDPQHSYLFTMVVFYDGPDNPPVKAKININLSDEEYASLLAWRLDHIKDGNISFNLLRESLPVLFNKISTSLEWSYCDTLFRLSNVPYAVFMDEVEEDVAAILAEKRV